MTELRIDAIRVGDRHRKQLGDIEALARSIAEVGLLHPIVVTPDGELVAGQRRLSAVALLGWASVPVTVVDLDDIVLGERAENVARLDFTPTEAVAIGRTLEERVRTPVGRPADEMVETFHHLDRGKTRDKIGEVVGMSGRSYDKASEVVEAAEREPETYGDLPELMDDKSIDRAYKEMAKRTREVERAALAKKAAALPPDDRWNVSVADIRTYRTNERFDSIITDPPYPREFLPLYGTLAERAAEWLKPGGSLLVMCGQSYLPDVISQMTPYLTYHWTLAYLTPGGQSVQMWQRNVNTFWKPVLWFVNGEYQGQWIGDVTKSATNDNDKRFHEWGQSESGMADIVERMTLPGDHILDPFCGAGTTGVVSVILNRRFTGIDINQSSVDSAIERITNEAG